MIQLYYFNVINLSFFIAIVLLIFQNMELNFPDIIIFFLKCMNKNDSTLYLKSLFGGIKVCWTTERLVIGYLYNLINVHGGHFNHQNNTVLLQNKVIKIKWF